MNQFATRRLTLLLLSILVCIGPSFPESKNQATPEVNKVEPPDWWIGLPSPMLLLKGKHFQGAHVKTSNRAVHVRRTQVSENGHWLFVWLDTALAKPGTFQLTVVTSLGRTALEFLLQARHSQSTGFAGFSPDDTIYLIMPDRFADGDPTNNKPPQSPGTFDRSKARAYHGGDLKGIIQHLDYLKQLGVTALWLTPVVDNDNRSPEDYHGYSAVDLYSVDEHFGTLLDYISLVVEAHRQGMKVLFDAVPNHVGPRHIWVADPPTPTWLHGTKSQHLIAQSNFPALTDPHAAPRQWRSTVEGWFVDLLPDLNQSDPLVSQYLIQNALWWIQSAQLDGLRLDTFPYVNLPFWHDFHVALHAAYPRLKTVGEAWNPDPTVVAHFAGGATHQGVDTGLDTPFDFPLYLALRDVVLRDASIEKLTDVLRQDWLYPHPEQLVTFLGNHDTKRFMSEQGATLEKLKLAFGLLLTLRGTPQIYSGDEIGMRGGEDPDNRRDFPGGFIVDGDSSRHNGFTPEGRTKEEAEMHDYLQRILTLRRDHPALRLGRQVNLFVDHTVYVFARLAAGPHGERVLLAANNADQPRKLDIDLTDSPVDNARHLSPIFGSAQEVTVESQRAAFSLEPRSVCIFQVE